MGLTWHRVRGIAWLSIRVKIGEQKCTDFSSVHMSKAKSIFTAFGRLELEAGARVLVAGAGGM